MLPPDEVQALRGGRLGKLIPAVSTLSSGKARWQGLTLEAFNHLPACALEFHEHPVHLLSLLLGGPAEVEWTTEGRTQRAVNEPGTIYLLPAGTRDETVWRGPTSRLLVSLSSSLLTGALEETSHLSDVDLATHWQLQDRHLASLMMALHADLEDGLPAGCLFGESLGAALAVYLVRRYGNMRTPARTARGGLPGYRLRRVLDYIGANYDKELRLAELAGVAGASPHYFAELFRQSTGMSPHRYVLALRIDRAKEQLRNPVLSILDVALQTGFASHNHFTKVFRRITGVTPSGYRAQV